MKRKRLKDYYEILGISQEATQGEIKSTFRKLAHKYHPDRNASRPKWAGRKLSLAVEAYRTLGDEKKRMIYDKRRKLLTEAPPGDPYRERLNNDKHQPEVRAKLILYDLMSGRADEAIKAFEDGILQNGGFNLAKFMPLKDWLDCTVLLAEEYERRNDFGWALQLYEEVHDCEEAKNRYGSFFNEITDRIRDLCIKTLPRVSKEGDAIAYYKRALDLDLSDSEAAFVHKKLAECHYEIKQPKEALTALKEAFRLNPNIKGTRRICDKLQFKQESRAE